MEFIADFHVHSKYSRATARDLDLESLYVAARIKGITVVGTGDFTHPAWFSEIREKLTPAEPGLFKLKEDIAAGCDEKVPVSCRGTVRFILTSEISNIYKKNGKTRKNHNLIFLPDLQTAWELNARLDRIGNIKSDGRPILGLDARNLLELLLTVSEDGFLIPAHIWTPWFSLLGSKSGFDSVTECFEDLAPRIFAVETGLSSDPLMNWRVSHLDNLTLVSNSDAHSPFNLGREANRFNTTLSYGDIKNALETGDPEKFSGTLEFFPEEGKYHLDGHRKCGIRFSPRESRAQCNICPSCGAQLTLGVLNRVEELADRREGERPEKTHPFHNIIPLTDILADIFEVGPKSKKVAYAQNLCVKILGPELSILRNIGREELDRTGIPLLGEAVERMRLGRIRLSPGYDGEYGKVHIFESGERKQLLGQKSLFLMPVIEVKSPGRLLVNETVDPKPEPAPLGVFSVKEPPTVFEPAAGIYSGLNAEQQEAVMHQKGPLMITAGPGTGKTRTITHRIAYLVREKGISPEHILAVTFTHKAAREMKERLGKLLGSHAPPPRALTFHSFCHEILAGECRRAGKPENIIIDEDEQRLFVREALNRINPENNGAADVKAMTDGIVAAKQKILGPLDDLSEIGETRTFFTDVYQAYQDLLARSNVLDYEDLIVNALKILEIDSRAGKTYRDQFKFIFVDEYQDLNYGQYRLIQALSSPDKDLCVIGDPDQSIYGFRGSDARYFKRFLNDFPGARSISLSQNYRSTETILEGAFQVIRRTRNKEGNPCRIFSGINGGKTLSVLSASSEKAEAVAIGRMIENMVGGMGLHAMDFDKIHDPAGSFERPFSDFAVLYRTRNQGRFISDILSRAGIPCQVVSREDCLSGKGIRELISYLKLMEGWGTIWDFERLFRIPGWGIGGKILEKFRTWFFEKRIGFPEALNHVRRLPIPGLSHAGQLKLDRATGKLFHLKKKFQDYPVFDILLRLAREPFLEPLLKQNRESESNMTWLLNRAKEFSTDASGFLREITLDTDTDIYDAMAQKVALLTLHAAKGLEFPVVIIAGCEDGLIPYIRSGEAETDMDEERRLFYVAMTRAKEHLCFSWAGNRNIYGKREERRLSPFVEDIEERLLHRERGQTPAKREKPQTQLSLF